MTEALFWRMEAERNAPGEPGSATAPCWRLCVGTHNGTMMSRDSSSEPYPNEGAALEAWAGQERTIASLGYKVWFATLIPPEGSGLESRTLHDGVLYF